MDKQITFNFPYLLEQEKRGVSRLCLELDIVANTATNWRTGKTKPSLDHLANMLNAYPDLTLEDLICVKDSEAAPSSV